MMQPNNTLKLPGIPPQFACLKHALIVFLASVAVGICGCGVNQVPGGQPVANNNGANELVPKPVGVPGGVEVVLAPGVASDEDAHVEVMPDDDSRPPAKTGLVRGLTQMLNSTPLQDDQKDSIRGQMEEADNILYRAKKENQDAMRNAFRQMRIRGIRSPNIIQIVADDLCVSDLSCYGPSEILTPNIDRLSQAGTRFTQAYAGSPDSADARWCLVAGRRPDQARARSGSSAALQSGDITIAEVMWQAGYTTGVFGHWGVMSASGAAEPDDQGYDEWVGTFGPPDEPQPYPEFVFQNGNKLRLIKNSNGQNGQFVQDFFVAEANAFLSRNAGRRPMFLQFFFSVPGVRRTIPQLEHYADKQWPDEVKIRAAAITRMDRDIGKLVQRLEDLRLLSNTVFVITSDTAGDPALESSGSGAEGVKFRGRRGDLYEGGLRVPLIISGTNQIPSGVTSEVVTAAWDLPATFYQLAQVAKVPQRKQGQSILPYLKPNAPQFSRFLKWELKSGSPAFAVRMMNWKAIRMTESASWDLYDLTTDPLESDNVAAENPDVIAQIVAKWSPTGSKVARGR